MDATAATPSISRLSRTSEICHAMINATTNRKGPRNRVGSRELVSADELLAHEWPLGLALCPNEEDGPFDGSCPCAVIHGQGFEVETRCWRVAGGHSEIHISGTLPKADLQRIAEHIRENNGWTHSTEWQIHLCPNNASQTAGGTSLTKVINECSP